MGTPESKQQQRGHTRRYWSSRRKNLAASIATMSSRMGRLLSMVTKDAAGENARKRWERGAEQALSGARLALKNNDIEIGYRHLQEAELLELELMHAVEPAALQVRAVSLAAEAHKKLESGWRGSALARLIPEQPTKDAAAAETDASAEDGPAAPKLEAIPVEAVMETARLLQEHHGNMWRRLGSLRVQLWWLSGISMVVLLSILATVSLVPDLPAEPGATPPLPARPPELALLLTVVLFGVFGGAISGLHSLLTDAKPKRIPEFMASGWMTLARVVLGGGSALVLHYFLESGMVSFGADGSATALTYAVAFAAGFSSRLLLDSVGKLGG